jgi:predicted lipoprotein
MAQMKRNENQSGGIFEQIAAQYGVSVGEVVRDIQTAVDEAWNNPDPAIRARQRELFPNGKPSVEEFIRVMAEQVER